MRPPNALLVLLFSALPAVSFAASEPSSTRPVPFAEEAAFPGDDLLRIRIVELVSRAPVSGVELGALLRVDSTNGSRQFPLSALAFDAQTGEALLARSKVDAALRRTEGRGVFEIRPRGFFEERIALRPALEPWPTETAVLELPPWGWVRFEARDEHGQRLATDAQLSLDIAQPPLWSHPSRPKLRQGLSERFPCALGLAFDVEGTCADGSSLVARGAAGPATLGSEVRIVVRPQTRAEPFRVRVLLAAGAPLVEELVEVSSEVTTPTGPRESTLRRGEQHLTTDEQGWILVPDADADEPRTRHVLLHFTHDHATRGRLTARLQSTIDPLPASRQLGEVQLEEPSLLCAGTVIDHLGRPIAGARLSAALSFQNHGELLDQQSIHGSTDSEGRFCLMRTLPASSAELEVQSPGTLPCEPLRIEAGTRDLVLQLHPAARLFGSVFVPAGMAANRVRVSVHLPASPGSCWDTQPAADGSFALAGLAPGSATVTIVVPMAGVSFEVPGVRLVAGEACRDARLQQLELCQGWRQLHLRVLENSVPVGRASWFWISSIHASERPILRPDLHGVGSVWVPPTAEHFEIRGRRHRPSTFSWQPTLQELNLRPGIRVALPLEVPAFEALAQLELKLLGEDESHPAHADIAHGIAEFVVQEPGRYRLVAQGIFRNQGDVWDSELALDQECREIEIGEGQALRLPALRLREEQLRAARERR